ARPPLGATDTDDTDDDATSDGETASDGDVAPDPDTGAQPMGVRHTAPSTTEVDTKQLAGFGSNQLDTALAAEGIIDMASMRKKARAGNLKVSLPPSDLVLPRNDLVVAGVTDPANEIVINGKHARVKANGVFKHVVTLPDGESTLTIESVDPEGNRGRIEWPVSVAPVQYFLMAFADTAVSSSNMRLAGANDHSSWDTG